MTKALDQLSKAGAATPRPFQIANAAGTPPPCRAIYGHDHGSRAIRHKETPVRPLGFPTNITFSEGIGFLTRSDPDANVALLVTAHEAANQWWGNILTPGKGPNGNILTPDKGPNGNILADGMAHFSTVLLFEQVKGPRGRIEFLKGIESRYEKQRRRDSDPRHWQAS